MFVQRQLPYFSKLVCLVALCVFALSSIAEDRVFRDVAYGRDALQKLDIYQPTLDASGDLKPVHIFIHGGAWRMGDKSYHDELGPFYSSRGLVLVSINYRLFPEDEHPAQIQDVARAVHWVYENIDRYGGDRQHIVLSGHSAGAHLAALVATDEQYLARYQLTTDLFHAVVPVDTASFDFTQPADTGNAVARFVNRTIKQNFGASKEELMSASPLFHAEGNTRLPAFQLFVTSNRPEAVKQTWRFAQVLRQNQAAANEVMVIPELSHREMGLAIFDPGSPVAQTLLALLAE